ncbi:DUF3307 domain-containing protein [Engelhardtia mirabilis]|uniref:DUF3307 domain-containing protein n=1 Tax=Engelhardtia mirabilis TaxID=2528011 RepID=A0A518BLZ7_9BACT|nr:hypothetical protein Pla133_30910 [Planctomycetes bacterium Pla133]QDV02326.1 hypothetical protein Pla86_30900 [Planctomycetes bacterium Pla86]
MELWQILHRWSHADGAELTLLALLFAGHMLGDFVFQSARMVEGKRRSIAVLMEHGAWVTLCHVALVLPLVPFRILPETALGLGLLGLAHLLIDRWKTVVEARDAAAGRGRRFRWWVIDQLAHMATLGLAWRGIIALIGHQGFDLALPVEWYEPVRILALTVAVLAFNVHGGSAIVGAVLDACERREQVGFAAAGAPEDPSQPWGLEGTSKASKGRVIGILERLLLALFVLFGAFGAIGFVLAGKSIARFKELEDRDFTEGYLVGTLASTLVAVTSGLLLTYLI